jgi:hypothetical protein
MSVNEPRPCSCGGFGTPGPMWFQQRPQVGESRSVFIQRLIDEVGGAGISLYLPPAVIVQRAKGAVS